MPIDFLGYLFRFLALVIIQVLFFNHIHLFYFVTPFVYLAFLLTLPVNIKGAWILLIAFLLGLSIDVFTNTLGMHAAACVMAAFSRTFVLNITAPRDGFEFGAVPNVKQMGLSWFLVYASIIIFIHHFTLYWIELFKFSEVFHAFYKTLGSGLFTLVIIVLLQLLNAKSKAIE